MLNQVLIVAAEQAAQTPAEVVRSLRFTPVVAGSEQEAVELLDRERFRLIAVSGNSAWQRLREAAESKQPMTRVLELPEPATGDDTLIRRLIVRYLAPASSERSRFSTEERYRFLSTILESFTATLDLREVLRRIVAVSREQFGADRAWLLAPVHEQAEFAKVVFSVSGGEDDSGLADKGPVPLAASQALIRRAMEAPQPIVARAGDAELDPELAARFRIRSAVVQVLRPREEEPWAFGMHMVDADREWTEEELSLFNEIGRYATLALNNTLLHNRSVREMAKVNAILDQIPEAAAIYNANGKLERMNAAAQREPAVLFTPDADGRIRANRHRYVDGSPLSVEELPSMRALRGETVKSDYLIHDARSDDDRVVNLKAAPIRDDHGRVVGSVVLSRDVTDERQSAERESWRRRRAECLANLGLEMAAMEPSFDRLDDSAARIALAINGFVRIYLYHPATGTLDLVGFAGSERDPSIRDFYATHPYRPGEGLAGTVFQIGRPLLFFEVRGDALLDYARDDEEREVKARMREQSLIAMPIDSYGERIGALILSQSDPRRNFDAEDLEFAQSVAERVGAASHIHRLTRMAQDGHRAAEELARREVDARVRFEAVLENAPVGIAVFSADELRFELANARFIDFAVRFGKIAPDTRVIGLRADEVLSGMEQILKQVADSGEPRVEEELQFGDVFVNRIISAARGRFSGITQSLTVLVQDVTDRVRARREIENLATMMAERSARLDSILGSMTDGLWVYDANGQVVDVNQAALNMFGLASRAEAVEHGSFGNLHLRDAEGRAIARQDMPYARALSGQTVPDYLAIGRHLITGRDLDLSIAAAPIESKGVVGAVLVIRDITALQELDRKKDEFLSVASHELRTPLTTIKGYTQLLAQTVDDLAPEERATYINAVLGEIERMMGLISELLDVSRIETNRLQIHPQSIRWTGFIEGRVSAFRVQHPTRDMRYAADADELIVVADPDRMRQVVDNLLSNALKYSAEGSDIDVRVAVTEHGVQTSVSDHGIGIPRDEIPQLFERFHRARNVSSRYYGGLGLGLYIARAIVEAHGGAITVESEEGVGSTFTMTLPYKA
ncbi:MAG TPA: ATP-binding protein [Thermoanaerobaculia bacterium]|jgi:PAS domain S-box-containing protein